MSLGSAVLRPQGLQETPAHGAGRILDLVAEFIETLLRNPEDTRNLVAALAESGAEALPSFLYSRQEKLRLAEGKIRLLFRPFAEILDAFLADLGEGIGESAPGVIQALRRIVEMLRVDNATRFLRELIRLGRDDLEISGEAVETLFRAFLGGATSRLQAGVTGGDLSEESLGRYELGISLRNLEHLILEELVWPSLDVETLASSLRALYAQKGLEQNLGRISRVLEALESLAVPLGTLLETLLAGQVSAGGSVGAAANPCEGVQAVETPMDDHRTLGDEASPFGYPESAELCWYVSWLTQKNTYGRIADIKARHGGLSFAKISPEAMEQIAFHTAWSQILTDFILHFISSEQDDMASNILNMLWDNSDLWATVIAKHRIQTFVHWLTVPFWTTLGGLEGTRCSGSDDALYPFTLFLADWGETIFYKRWTWLLREALLSFLTLLNHKPQDYAAWRESFYLPHHCEATRRRDNARDGKKRAEAMTDAEERERQTEYWGRIESAANSDLEVLRRMELSSNHNAFHGLCYFFGEIGHIILPAILSETDRANYGATGPAAVEMVGKAFGGLAIAWPMTWLSILLCRASSGDWPTDTAGMILLPIRERQIEHPIEDGANTGTRITFGILFGVFEFGMQLIYRYLFSNANTAGGTYSGLPGIPGSYPGYPANPGNSPYRLPWAAPQRLQCVQNPMGIWSHFPNSGQTYAYDYSHDAGTEVLNSRDGIVTAITQGQANNNPNNWNRIEILHLGVVAAGTAGSVLAVPPPFPLVAAGSPGGTNYQDGTTNIDPGTLFPPYWDVNGNFWPLLPGTMPFHPSGTILPAGSPLSGGIASGSAFVLLNPNFDRGLNGVQFPPGTAFSDGTPIPAGVVFAPGTPNPPAPVTPMYRAGTTFAPVQINVGATPFAAPGPGGGAAGVAPASGATFLDGVAIPAGVILPPDCGVTPAWLPSPHQATPLYLPGTLFTALAGGTPAVFNAGTNFVPVGTPAPAVPAGAATVAVTVMSPAVFTFCEYGHALQNFTRINSFPPAAGQPSGPLTDVFPSATANQILGMRVLQGRVIMLSGDTGISAYNHLHTHVLLDSSARNRNTATIPFVYADATHGVQHGFREAALGNGVPHAMNWYESQNTRTGP